MEEKKICKVAVLGAESTGKTWLCERLAKHYGTVWVPEYAREYFHDSDIYNYTLQDLVVIAEKQFSLEQDFLMHARRIMFCDTTLITLKIWAELEFRRCPDEIIQRLQLSTYDLYLITENDIPWQADPLRQNKHSRDELQRLNIEEVVKTGAPFTVIGGNEENRLLAAIREVDRRILQR